MTTRDRLINLLIAAAVVFVSIMGAMGLIAFGYMGTWAK